MPSYKNKKDAKKEKTTQNAKKCEKSLDKPPDFCYNNACEKYAVMAQLAEHVLGKDEVPGSNPGNSSRKKTVFGCLFSFCFIKMLLY